MATKSFLKNINIKDKYAAERFVNALESAEKKSSVDVVLQKSFTQAKKEDLETMFGK